MNLRQLYYFKELTDQKQFSKAAKKLNISQPSLSNSIKTLEKELDCQLINREGGQISLTTYGKIFYKAVVSSIQSLESAKRQIDQHKKLSASIVKIASISSAFSDYLLPTITKFQKINKANLQYAFDNLLSKETCLALRNGKYDLGICSKVEQFSDLKFIPLYNEPIVVLANPTHPLANRKLIKPADLSNQKLITYDPHTLIGKRITNSLLAANPKIKIHNYPSDEISMACEVLTNNLLAIVIDTSFINQFNLVKIPLDLVKATRTVYLAYNPKKEKTKEINDLIQFMIQPKNA